MSSKKSKRVVFKFGTGILTSPKTGALERSQIRRLTSEVAAAVREGHECLIVSSGAVGSGLSVLGYKERPTELHEKQACAAVGQSLMMRDYETCFAKHGLHVAQILLTHPDLDSRRRHANARGTLLHLLRQKSIVPIINENDVVAVDELRFGDNDELSAEVAILAEASLLVILTSVDGLLQTLPSGERLVVQEIRDLDAARKLVDGIVGRNSTGGMTTKLAAARHATENGVEVVIANGRTPDLIPKILSGEQVGTRFPVSQRRAKSR